MPGLLETCNDLFGTSDLYEVLEISKDATPNEVKRGYYKLSLKVHPDRASEADKESSTERFQALGKAYSILQDKKKRAVYDETGEVDDENDIPQDRDWFDYWRLLYHKVSVEDIKEFEKGYRGSDEEIADLKVAYMDYEGDMDQIIDNVLCSTVDDENRFREILNKFIDQEELPAFDAFTKDRKKKQKARKKKAEKEAKEAEEHAKELGIDADESLKSLILKRNQNRAAEADNFFAQLEAKYAQPNKKSKASKKK